MTLSVRILNLSELDAGKVLVKSVASWPHGAVGTEDERTRHLGSEYEGSPALHPESFLDNNTFSPEAIPS